MANVGKNEGIPRVSLPSFRKGLRQFVEDIVKEMKRVVWPTKEDVARLTALVVLVCIVFMVYLWVCGTIMQILLDALMGKGLRF
ncbi:MAG: preprotein translocase subunit SecE [Fimbriimonadales bacterium]|nr:preprotein translocase subunit SecE [Fimbriimonadales bacterium]